jgi:hypothetical protein
MRQETLFDLDGVDQADNTPASLPLKRVLIGQDERMAGSNAGKKRNVFARGDDTAWHSELTFSGFIRDQVNAAAEESGNYSPALYLELFIRDYVAEHGALPAVPASLITTTEVSTTAAA